LLPIACALQGVESQESNAHAEVSFPSGSSLLEAGRTGLTWDVPWHVPPASASDERNTPGDPANTVFFALAAGRGRFGLRGGQNALETATSRLAGNPRADHCRRRRLLSRGRPPPPKLGRAACLRR